MDKKIISWPKCLNDSIDSYEFFFSVQKIVNSSSTQYILLDMSNTKIFSTNLLSLVYLLIDENKEKIIKILLPNKQEYSDRKALLEIFDIYTGDTRSFFKPRIIVGNINTREAEDVLLKYLRNIDLKNYGIIKTLLSELIANIKMHVQRVENTTKGYLAATYIKETNYIAISIVNSCRTILTTLKDKNYEFNSNEDAIIWALKKSNSTRDDEESGGIGLYLLRKYITKLKGGSNHHIRGLLYVLRYIML